MELECGYRLDILVANSVVIEIKSVETLNPVNDSQLIMYLKLGGWKIGLLINFNVAVLKSRIHRKVLNFKE